MRPLGIIFRGGGIIATCLGGDAPTYEVGLSASEGTPRMRRSLIRAFPVLIVCAALAPTAMVRAQSDDSRPVIIQGGTVWTGTDRGTIESGTVALRKGKIWRVGPAGRSGPPRPGMQTIDADGKYVTPGLIDAWTMLGLDLGGAPGAGASLSAADAINGFATHVFEDARRSGVTSLCIEPPAGGGIAGTAAMVRLANLNDLRSTTTESISLVARLGLGVRGPIGRLGEIKALREMFEQAAAYREQWDEYNEKLEEYEKKLKDGETVKLKKDDEKKEEKTETKKPDAPRRRSRRGRRPRPRPSNFSTMTDEEVLAWLRDSHVPGDDDVLEEEAHDHDDHPTAPDAEEPKKDDAKKADGKDGDKKSDELTKPERPAYDANSEIVVKALKRQISVRFEAHRPGDIAMALKIVNDYHLDALIVGATGARFTDKLIADAEVPVLFGQLTGAGGFDRTHAAQFDAQTPAALRASGVLDLVIASGRMGRDSGVQFLTQNAAIAVGHGLDEDAALRAITIEAAKVCGVGETLGSIEKGKLADVVIWSGHPLAPDTVVERVFVGGVEVYRRAGN